MYVEFQSSSYTIRALDRKEYHCSELNGKKILEMTFIEEHNGEVVYKVMLEGGIKLMAFSDEIIGGKRHE